MNQRVKTRSMGYSLVEVLIVIVITTVGFLSLINLQIGTLHAVGTTKSMMQAVNLAEHFIETLKGEAVLWKDATTDFKTESKKFPNLMYLGNSWTQAYKHMGADQRVGPLGRDDEAGIANEIRWDRERRFCVYFRLVWIVEKHLIRADVRVMWLRDEANIVMYESCQDGMHTDMANVSTVTIPGTIMRNVFSAQ